MSEFKSRKYEVTNGGSNVKSDAIDNYCDRIGLIETSMQEDLHTMFSQKHNNYPNTSIKKPVKDYRLEKKDTIYRFIRK